MVEELKTRKGFIAALDQSGGSSKKTLVNYGINENDIKNDEEMFNYIHEIIRLLIEIRIFYKLELLWLYDNLC